MVKKNKKNTHTRKTVRMPITTTIITKTNSKRHYCECWKDTEHRQQEKGS